MAQIIKITLTTAGIGTGPFDLYSIDGSSALTGPFETNISKAALVAGYTSILVPTAAVTVRVKSVSVSCINYVDIPLP